MVCECFSCLLGSDKNIVLYVLFVFGFIQNFVVTLHTNCFTSFKVLLNWLHSSRKNTHLRAKTVFGRTDLKFKLNFQTARGDGNHKRRVYYIINPKEAHPHEY